MGTIAFFVTLLFAFSPDCQAAPKKVPFPHPETGTIGYEEASREVKELLSKEPKDGRLLEIASLVAFHQGAYEEALGLIKSAIRSGRRG